MVSEDSSLQQELASLTKEQLIEARNETRSWLALLGGYSLMFERWLGGSGDPAAVAAEEEAREEAAWAQRGRIWEDSAAETPNPPRAYRWRKVEPKPLVLVGHDVRLRVH